MMNAKTSLRVACAGTGYFSQFHYDAWRRIGAVKLVASASLDLAEAEATGLPAFTDVRKMLDSTKPDVLDIITPPASHLDIIQVALASKVQLIICQKPFCENLGQAKKAIVLCEAAGIPLVIHENFRFQPWYRTIKQAIDDGLAGDVHQLTFRLRTGDGQGPNAYLDRQPYFQKMEKFLIRETGIHWIDTFRYLLGEPDSVYADLRKMNPIIQGEDAGYFLFGYEAGTRALFDANRHLDHAAENCRTTLGEALLEGTKGVITLEGSGAVMFRQFGSTEFQTLLKPIYWQGFGGDCVFALQTHIVEQFLGEGKYENIARDYLRNLEIEETIYDSADKGVRIAV